MENLWGGLGAEGYSRSFFTVKFGSEMSLSEDAVKDFVQYQSYRAIECRTLHPSKYL